jgi:hypothetical protein
LRSSNEVESRAGKREMGGNGTQRKKRVRKIDSEWAGKTEREKQIHIPIGIEGEIEIGIEIEISEVVKTLVPSFSPCSYHVVRTPSLDASLP